MKNPFRELSQKLLNRRSGFASLGFILTLLLTTVGLQALQVVEPKDSASAATNVSCSSTMTAQLGFKATPSHGQVFYMDSGVTPKVDASYVGYTISNTTGSEQNVWVSVNNFIGGKVSLANPADEFQQITKLATGSSSTVFYLLKASGSTTVAQTHTVKVWDRRPDLDGAVAKLTCDFKFVKVQETIKASANKISKITKTLVPSTATLGGLVSINIESPSNNKTQTETLGAGSAPDFAAFWASPAAYSTWPTQALRLESTTITIDCKTNGVTILLTNKLFVSDATAPAANTTLANCVANGQGSSWTATYNFRIIGPSATAIDPCPVANISSGTQYKHSIVGGLAAGDTTTIDLTAVSAASAMRVAVSGAEDTTRTSTPNAVRIKYEVKVSTSSTAALQVDEVVDTHDTLSSPMGYVSGSTVKKQVTSAGALVAGTSSAGPEPSILAGDKGLTPPPQHFIGPFTGITASASQILNYSFDVPCDGLQHKTTVVAYVGNLPIAYDSTRSSVVVVVAAVGTCATTFTDTFASLDPTATTTAATNVAATTASLNGILNASGNTGTSYRFIYATDATLAYATASTPGWTAIALSPSSNTGYSASISSLSVSTTYYFRIQIKNSSGTIFSGDTLSFTTLAQQAAPTVITTAASKVGSTVATLNGTLNANLTAIASVEFLLCTNLALSSGCSTKTVYTTDDATGNQIALVILAGSSGDYVVNSDSNAGVQLVTGLTGAQDYFFRLSATCTTDATYCPGGRINGAVLKFTTGAPSGVTSDASDVGGTTATLNGTVNANNTSASAVSFCYSSSSSATNGVLGTCNVGTSSIASISGSVDQQVASSLTGLTAGTTYYFQVKVAVASPSTVVTYGSILSFKTLGITTASLATGSTANVYAASFAGTGGSTSYTWSTNSVLPAGITLTSEGLLSGTPTESGTFTLDIIMTDPVSNLTVTKTFTLLINGVPTVATTGATKVQSASATINATVSPNGTTLTGASLCWGDTLALTSCTLAVVNISAWSSTGVNVASLDLTNLASNTTYYYKVTTTWAASSTVSSAAASFTTALVSTSMVSGVGVNGATLGGALKAGSSALDNNKVTEVKLCYSTASTVSGGLLSVSPDCGSTNLWMGSSVVAGLDTGIFSRALVDLDTNKQFWFQMKTTYAGGEIAYGEVRTFTTMDLPVATIDSALLITGKSAKIRGKVNPRGNTVSKVFFCYSTDSSLLTSGCTKEVTTTFITSSNADNSTDTQLADLSPGTKYYYLVYAKTANFLRAASVRPSSVKLGRASISTFSTLGDYSRISVQKAVAPSSDIVYSSSSSFTTAGATTDAVSAVLPTSATLNGTLTASSSGLANGDVKSVKLCYSSTNTLTNGVLDNAPQCSLTLWGSSVLAGSSSAGVGESKTFSSAVSGLTQGTQYYSQLQVVFLDNTVLNGVTVPFSTSTLQTATASSATAITSNTATLRGTVDAKGSTLSAVSFCYDTSNTFANCSASTISLTAPTGGWSTGINTISTDLTQLTSTQTYYFKILTSSNSGTVESAALNFKTLSILSFNAQGGSAVQSIEYATSATVSLANSTTIWAGHVFQGWFVADTGGVAVSTSYAVPGTTNQTLYAQWKLQEYAVTFDENGGSTVADTTYIEGGKVTNPGTPTLAGYRFLGWFDSDSGGNLFDFTKALTSTTPITIYAHWEIITYNVTFNELLGSATTDLTYTINGTISAPTPATTRAGYRFDGWFTDETAGTLVSFASYPAAGTAADITLFARWTAYQVSFSNGTYGGTLPPTQYGVVSLPSETGLTKPDATTFGGWQCPSGVTLAAGSSFEPTANVVCTAVWLEVGSVTVTFHKTFGSSTETSTQSAKVPTNLVNNSFVVTGHSFVYWCVNPTTAAANTCALEDRKLQNASYAFNVNTDLYAIWETNSYTITFNKNDGTLNPATTSSSELFDASVNLSSHTTSRTGYTFSGWSTGTTGTVLTSYQVSGSATLFAIWAINSYVITYNKNLPSALTEAKTYDYGITQALDFTNNWTKAGHTFKGWAASASDAEVGTILSSYTVRADASLYAAWTINTYVITFDINDETPVPATTSHSFSYGATTGVLNYATGFTRLGYTLNGWSNTGRGDAPITQYTVSGPATLYAHWHAGDNSVIFNKQNGTANGSGTFVTGSTVAAPGSSPTLAGNQFLGWFTQDVDGSSVNFPYAPGTVGTLTLFAHWSPWRVTFTLGSGGGTAATGTAPAARLGVIDRLPGQGNMVAPTASYVFSGWKCAGSDTSYLADSSITPTGDITCEAVWALNSDKTVTFNSNYPAGVNTSTTQSGGAAANLAANPFVAGGFSFAGWALTPTGPILFANRDQYDFLLDAQLYAKWNVNSTGEPSFVIEFKYQGGEGGVTVTYYSIGNPGVSLPQATRPGYLLAGWSQEPVGTTFEPSPFTTSRNVALFAQWVPLTVTITFNYLGGKAGLKQKTYKVGDPGLTLPTSTKAGFAFGGWSEVNGGSAPVAQPYSPLKNTTLYAIWNGTQYIVTLEPVNGEPAIKLTYTVGQEPFQLPSQANERLTFIGWNSVTNAIKAVPNPYTPIKSITLYPVWREPSAKTLVYFTGDSAALTTVAKSVLKKLARTIYKSKQHRQLVVDGWVKETLNKNYDLQLSAQRAKKTAAYLKSLGIDAFARLTPRGISPENNDTSRRANIAIFYSGPKKS